MITEDSLSENTEEKTSIDANSTKEKIENQAPAETEKSVEIPEKKIMSEIDSKPEKPEEKVVVKEIKEPTAEISESEVQDVKELVVVEEIKKPTADISESEVEQVEENHHSDIATLSLVDTLKELESIINKENAATHYKAFGALKEHALQLIHHDVEDKKAEFSAETHPEGETFSYTHPFSAKLNVVTHIFKDKQDVFHKNQEVEQSKNLNHRQSIIDRLKNLYTNSEPGINLFKEIRSIKEDWQNAGQVAKSDFKLLNNNYFHHLNQFYAMLDMNKEYLEQEYAHNLEKRQHIILRAKELADEPMVQKALNELQYLHKLWKEEAEPVSEEFREKTWDEFKEISNKIHDRKTELSVQIDTEQTANLEKKVAIIAEIKSIIAPEKEPNHNYWQNGIKKVEDLREQFLKLGSVPRKHSNQNWNDFKQTLRDFNIKKNDFYKNLKGSQHTNLEEKLKIIASAKDNMHSEDWETTVPLYKKLQDDWKKIGHVPRSQANKIWDEFREACNTFFNNFREKHNAVSDNWKENLKLKKALLEELKVVTDEEGSVGKIETIKTSWNAIGKVPREQLTINSEFNKILREKLKLNKINEFDLKEEGLSETQMTDKARKMKNQIADLEAEIVKLETNLGFFNNPTKENPLLRETFEKIEDKKANLESLKQSLHQIINHE